MCVYCERRKDVKVGWNQPPLCDENWVHPSYTINDRISSNVNVDGESDWEARIHDYQTATPELIVTSKTVGASLFGEDGIASIHIPIKYCPVCGRKLGNNLHGNIEEPTEESPVGGRAYDELQ